MARSPPRTNNAFGPAGACDACGRFCMTLDQAGAPGEPGIACYHDACRAGQFRHRSEWDFWPCPACGGVKCGACHYTGTVAVPRER
jgi:hypothetical protein